MFDRIVKSIIPSVIALFLGIPDGLQAQENPKSLPGPLILRSDSPTTINATSHLTAQERPTGSFSLEKASSPEALARYAPLVHHSIFDEDPTTETWYRLKILNQTEREKWVLELEWFRIYSRDLYITGEGCHSDDPRPGDDSPHLLESPGARWPAYAIHLPAGKECTLWIGFEANLHNVGPANLLTPEAYRSKLGTEWIYYVFFQSAILTLTLYNLFLFFSIRDRSYFYYALVGLAFFLSNALNLSFPLPGVFHYQAVEKENKAANSIVLLVNIDTLSSLE